MKEDGKSQSAGYPAGQRFRMPRRATVVVFIVLVGLGCLLRAGFFWNSVVHIPPSSDESMTMLLAKGILEDGDSQTFQAKQHPRFLLGRFPLLFVAVPYLFPVESYLIAPFVRLLPSNALGARTLLFVLGLLMVFLSLLVLRESGGIRAAWPAAVLILFPSAYLMIYQAGYALPGYYSFLFLASAVALLVILHTRGSAPRGLIAASAGFLAGLAFSDTLTALPLLIAAGMVIGIGPSWKKTFVSTAFYCLGAFAGIAPWFAAGYLYPEAFTAVSHHLPLESALRKLWSPALNCTVPAVLGVQFPVFPDVNIIFSLVPWMTRVAGVTWSIVLLAATAVCFAGFGRRLVRHGQLSAGPLDFFTAMSWLALLIFVFSARTQLPYPRYMLLTAWCFPFVVGYLYLESGRVFRAIIGALTVVFVIINVVSTVTIGKRWAEKDFAVTTLCLHDVGPLVRRLEERGITRCYSTSWNSYRINFASDERIICSAPYNELFPEWPIPYLDEVDASTNVAVVLSPGFRFQPRDFERDMKAGRISWHSELCGSFMVYTDFQLDSTAVERAISPSGFEVATSHCPGDAAMLNDTDPLVRWRARSAQEQGMWIEVRLPARRPLCGLAFFYDGYPFDMALLLNVLARDEAGGWKTVAEHVPDAMDLGFQNGHPVFSKTETRTIRFEPVETDALRVEIARPNEGRDWTIGEVEVYERCPP